MKLKLISEYNHTELVSSCCWTSDNTLYSMSDDKTILTWNNNGDFLSKFMDLENYCTSCEWSNISKMGGELLAIGGSDGSLTLVSKSGKIEKKVENAHSTAIICIKWNSDGQAIATCGEDGLVKIWSKLGVLRSKLAENPTPVYSLAWSPDENYMLYTCGKNLAIKPIFKSGNKALAWKAHDEIVLCVDWNFSNKLIISGGEDKKYKIWDQFGRNLFVSLPYNYVTTSIAWAPSGEYFAVGSSDMLRLCNKTGWTYSFNKVDSGSLFKLAWSGDGTTVAGAGGNGSVVFGNIIDRSVTWKNIEVRLDENNKLIVTDFETDGFQEIDFKERLIDMTLGYDYLIVVTSNQCYIYNIENLNSPYKFETISRAASPGGTGASRCCLSGLTFTGRVYIISVLSLCIHNYRACGAYPQARFCVRAGHALSDLGNRSAISGAVKAESARYRPDLRGLIRFWMRVNCSKAYSIRFMGDRDSWIK